MRFVLICLCSFICFTEVNAQCKTFYIGRNGDTLNCVDTKNRKQGKWIIKKEALRGNPGYTEEGKYKDDMKEGEWRMYGEMGDLLAVENYRWGNKDGISKYYTIAGLEHEESWKAINPENPYDTVDVIDVIDDRNVKQVLIKREPIAYENGTWTYYNPSNGSIIRVLKFNMGVPVIENVDNIKNNGKNASDSSAAAKSDKNKPKPKEVLEFEKKYSNKKKKMLLREGRTGY